MTDLRMAERSTLHKSPTGIRGLDQITGGGLPSGRPTLLVGGPGCGKSLLAMEFLVRGAELDEPGVFLSFEEGPSELDLNSASIGLDVAGLVEDGRLHLDHVHVDHAEIREAGEYDLDGLLVRLAHGLDSVGARRLVLDAPEAALFGFQNRAVVRSELQRVFQWLKDRGVTTLVTAEPGGDGSLTRRGLEEYLSDCVILLDHRVVGEIPTRRLRIVKYRGSRHGTNEYPFLISDRGISVVPITGARLEHGAPTEKVSTGISGLDRMLGGEGFFRGSTVLVSGTPGTGKSTIGCSLVDAACRRGERALYCSFEESPRQILRNMRSVGLDLEPHLNGGLLRIDSMRPTLRGMESHLVDLLAVIEEFDPRVAVFDPVTALLSGGEPSAVRSLAVRLIDALKAREVTALFTSLTEAGATSTLERSEVEVSSVMDCWIVLRDLEEARRRKRSIFVLKSRGMSHSHAVRDVAITDLGVVVGDGDRKDTGSSTGGGGHR